MSTGIHKRHRVTDVGNDEDFISNLPYGILDHILSFLTTKEAVRTSVLSKYWKCQWNSILNVDINDTEFLSPGKCAANFFRSARGKKSFRNFLEKTLLVLHSQNIKNFHLSYQEYYRFRHIKLWMSSLLRNKIENLTIIIFLPYKRRILPDNIFSCTSLVNLELKLYCTLKAPSYNLLPNLKTLNLSNVKILCEDSNIGTLRYDFPNLEIFNIEICKWVNVKCVEFHVPSLTKFSSHTYFNVGVDDYSIKIIGAKLTEFVVHGRGLQNFNLCQSQVASACLHHRLLSPMDFGLHVRKLLEGFVNVESLGMSASLMRAIANSKSRLPLLSFYRLGRLILSCMPDVSNLIELLQATPLLKSLKMNALHDGDNEYTDEIDNNEMRVPSCFRNSLEEVEFSSCTGKTNHLHLAKYVLGNGVKLRKALFLVHFKAKTSEIKVVKTYPRGSRSLELIVL